MQLTEEQVAEIQAALDNSTSLDRQYSQSLIHALRAAYAEINRLNEGWEPADAPELDLNEGLKRMYLEAEAELTALRDQLRWRTPDENGVWVELPEDGSQVLVTYEEGGELKTDIITYNYFRGWYWRRNIQCAAVKVVAWRPRPAPYVPDTKEQAP